MEELRIIEQALNIAAKQGVFNIQDSHKLHTALEHVKKSYEFYKEEYECTKGMQKFTQEVVDVENKESVEE